MPLILRSCAVGKNAIIFWFLKCVCKKSKKSVACSFSQSSNSYHRSNSSIAEESQLTTFAPYIQAFLTQTTRRYSCFNVMLPLAFERAARNSFVNPKFDSQVLEGQYQISILQQIRLRFRWVDLYYSERNRFNVRDFRSSLSRTFVSLSLFNYSKTVHSTFNPHQQPRCKAQIDYAIFISRR